MVTSLCLFTCVLAAAQPPAQANGQFTPRINPGTELVYSGSFKEEAVGKGVQFTRSYRLETRILVLETRPGETEVALFTMLKQKGARPASGGTVEPSAIRLELGRLDSRGRLTPQNKNSFAVPLEGPPTVECGGFVEGPLGPLTGAKKWDVTETNRPLRSWQVMGTESAAGASCIKLVGLQQSDDWDRPRADRAAWRREDTVWIIPALGVAAKVERVIERREPARREPTQRSVASYTMDSRVVYPGQLFEDRRQEIALFRGTLDTVTPFLRQPDQNNAYFLEAVRTKLVRHMDNQPATPYREALVHLMNRIETARRGEAAPPDESADDLPASTTIATVGHASPDFVATNFATKESTRLKRILGTPIVFLFYNPNSRIAREVLQFAQTIADSHSGAVRVYGLAVSDDTDRILKQCKDFGVSVPILSGQGLRVAYGVDTTPKFVVLDADGIVRGAYEGWGKETPSLVTDELDRWLKRSGNR